MKKLITLVIAGCLCCLFLAGCGKTAPAAETEPAAAEEAAVTDDAAADSSGEEIVLRGKFEKIGDFLDAWEAAYKDKEAIINSYEGMPIMELVTPPMAFMSGVMFDLLNSENKQGRFEGELMGAGYPGFIERAGETITFGSDYIRDKDGYSPAMKKGDRDVENGTFQLDKGYFKTEVYTERGGKKIHVSYADFKKVADGNMICFYLNGDAFDGKGEAKNSNSLTFIHNGPDQYDFVVASAEIGPDFTPISLADKADLSKDEAIKLFTEAGWKIDQTGGIKDGKLVVD